MHNVNSVYELEWAGGGEGSAAAERGKRTK